MGLPSGIDVRVGPCFGLPFVAFGRWLGETRSRTEPLIAPPVALTLCGIFLMANVAELAIIKKLGGAGAGGGIPDARFATLFLGCAVLTLATSQLKVLKVLPLLAYFGKLSLGMYVVHLLWVKLIDYAGWTAKLPSVVLPAIVILLSAATAYMGAKSPLRRFFL